MGIKSIYGNRAPRDAPAYGLKEAAGYLSIPTSTLRSWTLGQHYVSGQGEPRSFFQVIQIADPELKLLSFTNLCEAHVCDALRRNHRITMQAIRRALGFLRNLSPRSEHPLVDHAFVTSGVDLLVEELGQYVNLTAGGQTAMRECLRLYLKRVEFDEAGLVSRLFPFTRSTPQQDAPKVIVLDPTVLFGRPSIANTRIATSVVYERWAAGESSEALASDYGRSVIEIEEALRCERLRQAA